MTIPTNMLKFLNISQENGILGLESIQFTSLPTAIRLIMYDQAASSLTLYEKMDELLSTFTLILPFLHHSQIQFLEIAKML